MKIKISNKWRKKSTIKRKKTLKKKRKNIEELDLPHQIFRQVN